MIFRSIFVYPKFPENLTKLYTIAYNLWCTWSYDAINLFYRIDGPLFRAVHHNPIRFLFSLPREKVNELSNDQDFLAEMESVWKKFQEYMAYKGANAAKPVTDKSDIVAYFCMEFGLHECIPIYGGGLGILAGDFLKSASDLNIPMVGVGLIYKYGYFNQRINLEGRQEEQYIEFDNHFIPMHELTGPEGGRPHLEIKLLNQPLKIKLWEIDVGLTKLILLDTDIDENPPNLRDITYELYVANRTKRLQQELVLGLGGVKALEMLNIDPKVYHINEGHSAFLVIARLQRLMAQNSLSMVEAKALIRASTVFTTHTPIIAGNENFDTELVQKYVEPALAPIGIKFSDFAADGFIEGSKSTFWLPALAIRYSKYINGVSKLHGQVSRRLWTNLFPDRPAAEIPIDYITNGVHRSWLSEPIVHLFSRHIGPDYVHCSAGGQTWEKIAAAPDEELWEAHHKNKQSLVTFIRKKLGDDLAARGYIPTRILRLSRLLNPEYLTVVFARRFARYKRAALILKDKERLKKILTDSRKPVQMIFAGKAHPADTDGKNMIQEIIDFARDYKLEDRVIFLENYDINVARHLAWGADVWLNTPVRENEASGTSGMKAAMNGVLNLSVLDGWWPEAYNGRNGWAITAGEYYIQSELKEVAEAEQIYDLLEEEITELYYDRNEVGVPDKWVKMMKESVASVCHNFNMNRVLTNYADQFYDPSKLYNEKLSQNNFQPLKDASDQSRQLARFWPSIKFAEFTTNIGERDHLIEQDRLEVNCAVNLDQAPENLFAVELFYMPADKDAFKIMPMTLQERKGQFGYYQCSFIIDGYGLQNINVRIKPANEIVQELHPELVKWAE